MLLSFVPRVEWTKVFPLYDFRSSDSVNVIVALRPRSREMQRSLVFVKRSWRHVFRISDDTRRFASRDRRASKGNSSDTWKCVIWIPYLSQDSLSCVNIRISAIGNISVEWKVAIERKTLITILWHGARKERLNIEPHNIEYARKSSNLSFLRSFTLANNKFKSGLFIRASSILYRDLFVERFCISLSGQACKTWHSSIKPRINFAANIVSFIR